MVQVLWWWEWSCSHLMEEWNISVPQGTLCTQHHQRCHNNNNNKKNLRLINLTYMPIWLQDDMVHTTFTGLYMTVNCLHEQSNTLYFLVCGQQICKTCPDHTEAMDPSLHWSCIRMYIRTLRGWWRTSDILRRKSVVVHSVVFDSLSSTCREKQTDFNEYILGINFVFPIFIIESGRKLIKILHVVLMELIKTQKDSKTYRGWQSAVLFWNVAHD